MKRKKKNLLNHERNIHIVFRGHPCLIPPSNGPLKGRNGRVEVQLNTKDHDINRDEKPGMNQHWSTKQCNINSA